MEIEILATGSIRTTQNGYNKLIDFFDRCQRYNNTQLLIDFSYLDWVDANMSALIMAIIQKLTTENRLKFFVDEAVIKDKFNILIRNGFISGLEIVPSQKGSEIKLTGFRSDDDVKFIGYIESELLSHGSLLIPKEDKWRLQDSFLELFSNVQKHARTASPIFACGQYYPSKKVLGFTLVDVGVGYLTPIREYTGGKVKTATQAIAWALKGNTTKLDAPGGLGLVEIQKFCKKHKAVFEIVTGDSYWSNGLNHLNGKPYTKEVKPFCGTTVNVIFDCSQKP